jgi:hypothetical protein
MSSSALDISLGFSYSVRRLVLAEDFIPVQACALTTEY